MKPRNVVWCPRGKHRLAWLETDESGSLVVAVTAVGPGLLHASMELQRFSVTQITDMGDLSNLMVGCACGARWSLDLAPVLDGTRQELRRITGDNFSGVSFDRPRH